MLHRLTLRVLPRLALAVTASEVRKRKRLVMLVPGLAAFALYQALKPVVPFSEPEVLLLFSGLLSAATAAVAYRLGRKTGFSSLGREDGPRRLAWLLLWVGFTYGVQLSLMVLALLKVLVRYDYLAHPEGPAMMAIIIACTSVARDAFEIGHIRRLQREGEPVLTFPDGASLRTLLRDRTGVLLRWASLAALSGAGLVLVAAQASAVGRSALGQLLVVSVAGSCLTLWAYLAGTQRAGDWRAAWGLTNWPEMFRFWWWPGLAFAATYYLVLVGIVNFLFRLDVPNGTVQGLMAGAVAGIMTLYGYYLGYRRSVEDRMQQTVPASMMRCPFVMEILSKGKGPARHGVRLGLVTLVVAYGLCGVVASAEGIPGPDQGAGKVAESAEVAKDIYYQTRGKPAGPPAPSDEGLIYPRYGSLDNRVLIWFVTQQHTYFGGFVLALPIFCMILEVLGLLTRDRTNAARYDGLAKDFLKVSLLAFSLTALVGTIMLTMFIVLYPGFMRYMGGTFKAMMPLYAIVFLGESLLLITYYYSWRRLVAPGSKWLHAAIGVGVNVHGAVLLILANSWAAFMMSPSGVDAQGRYLGNMWHLLHSALWNPLNVHRFLADLMSGGAVVLAYASYRFLTSKSPEERAYYDWVGYVFLFVTVCALLPMPFAGYWLMKSVYAFRQHMGMTMMGGLLTWLFVVQALLIGVLFLGINYYLWQSLNRVQGGERYQRYLKYLVWGLAACLCIWLTPHTLLMTPGEVKAVGGAQHPVIGNYGVMSAKNGAINVMICLTALSYIFYRRANRVLTVPWARTGNFALGVLFAAGIANIIWLAVYGFSLPASVRVGLSTPQAVTTLTVLIGGLWLNRAMMRRATIRGTVEWGKIPVRGMVALFGLAAAFSWVMGLMGYIRSSGRLGWHVTEILPDLSPWAFTPSFGFAAKMVTLNMVVFWLSALVLFWISSRSHQTSPVRNAVARSEPGLMPTGSREVQPL